MKNLSRDHIKSSKRAGSIELFIEEQNKNCVISRMPITKGIRNPFGTVQVGALIWLAGVTASVLAIGSRDIEAGAKGLPLANDLHTTLISNQGEGED